MKLSRESFTPRVLLATLVSSITSLPFAYVGIKLGLEGWLLLLFALPGAMLGTLVDREAFWGPKGDRPQK